MPTISIKQDYFSQLVGRIFELKEFEDLCFDFGLEAEEDTEHKGYIKVELPANRYDLFCTEGLALALRDFLSGGSNPQNNQIGRVYTADPPRLHIDVDPSVKGVRPFVVAGIVRDTRFTPDTYESFIDFQDKLHHNLGRKRTLVSIGTHDLDKVKGPFRYVARPREDFSFVPLGKKEAFTGAELLKLYESDFHLRNYLPILEGSPVVPLVLDAEGRVLSMPPIINSEFSKISLDTRNLFIEITAVDKTKALMALNAVLACFAQFASDRFRFERVEVREEGVSFSSPLVPLTTTLTCQKAYLERTVGVLLEDHQVVEHLRRMGHRGTVEGGVLEVQVPFFRNDVMHPCDIAEDLAISVGYNNVPFAQPDVVCSGGQVPLNKLTELTRHEMANAGYTECFTFALCSVEEVTTRLLKKADPRMVEIANVKTLDFQVGRTTLLTGLLKSLAANKSAELPLRLFEISDVVLLAPDAPPTPPAPPLAIGHYFQSQESVGAVNQRRICLAHSDSSTSGLDLVHGSLDLLFTKLFGDKLAYELRDSNEPFLFQKLQAAIFVRGERVGEMGVVHPEVLRQYKWPYPVSAMELDFEKLVGFYKEIHN